MIKVLYSSLRNSVTKLNPILKYLIRVFYLIPKDARNNYPRNPKPMIKIICLKINIYGTQL